MNPRLFLIGAWTLVITLLISKENTTRPRDEGLLHCNINNLARNRQTMGEWGGGRAGVISTQEEYKYYN